MSHHVSVAGHHVNTLSNLGNVISRHVHATGYHAGILSHHGSVASHYDNILSYHGFKKFTIFGRELEIAVLAENYTEVLNLTVSMEEYLAELEYQPVA